MSTKALGRLQKVELREAWSSESSGFTPWLAQEENLKLLGDAIGMELELESQEKEVGPYRADILCKDTATDSWVVIENQLARTDHSHLGQLLTYAAGLEAITIVWIAERFTEEHRATLDWLNERTDERINLFGLEIELWRIGDSPIAPKFNVISQPNDWARTVKQAAAESGEVSAHRQVQLRFWTDFKQYMESQASPVKCHKPAPQSWMTHPIGRSGAHLESIASMWSSDVNSKGPEIRVELRLDGPSAKQEFSALVRERDSIETALGFSLTWDESEGKAVRKLYTRENADIRDEVSWQQQFEWLRQRLETMHRVLSPIVKGLRRETDS